MNVSGSASWRMTEYETSVNYMYKVITFLLVLACGLLFSQQVSLAASQTTTETTLPLQRLQIDPVISDVHLVAGQTTVIPITVTNLSTEPLGLHAQISDVNNLDPDQISAQPSALLSWSSLSSSDVIFGPLEKKVISLAVHTAATVAKGGYGEYVFFTPFVSNEQKVDAPVVLSRIGALILASNGRINYNDLANSVRIVSFGPPALLVDHLPVSLSFGVENNYFSYFTAKPFLTIRPLFGRSTTLLLDEHHVFPGSIRTWHVPVSPSPFHIFYSAQLAVSVGDGKQILAQTYFLLLPYHVLAISAGGVLFIGCVWVLIAHRKRVRKALSILFQGN